MPTDEPELHEETDEQLESIKKEPQREMVSIGDLLQQQQRPLAEMVERIRKQRQTPTAEWVKRIQEQQQRPLAEMVERIQKQHQLPTPEWVQTIKLPMFGYRQQFRFSAVDDWIRPYATRVQEILEAVRARELKILRDDGPDNWAELHDTHDLRQLLDVAETGIPVTWVPRTSILAELLDAEPDKRLKTLMAHHGDVLDDCLAASAAAGAGPFAEQSAFMEQAIAATRHNLPAAAQALAASVLDTVLRKAVHEPVRRGYYGKVKEMIDSAEFAMLPWAVTHWPVLTALTTFNGGEEPPPEVFNRHATAHAVGSIQYSAENALIAIMLATSVLREAHHDHVKVEAIKGKG